MLAIRDMVDEQTIYTFQAEGPINITAGVSLPGVFLTRLQFPEIRNYRFRNNSFTNTHSGFKTSL